MYRINSFKGRSVFNNIPSVRLIKNPIDEKIEIVERAVVSRPTIKEYLALRILSVSLRWTSKSERSKENDQY